MYNVIMHYLNSFLSWSIRNLTLASLFKIKMMFFSPFTSLIPAMVFFHESNH